MPSPSTVIDTRDADLIRRSVPTGAACRSLVSFTRPDNVTAYTAGDVIGIQGAVPANAGSAIHELTNAGPEGGILTLRTIRLRFGATSVPAGMTTFRVWLFNASPTAVLDNAAWPTILTADRDKALDYVDLSAAEDVGEHVWSAAVEINKEIALAAGSTSVFAIIQSIGGWTPAALTPITLEMIGY